MPEIPVNEYYEYFGPDYVLDVKASNTDDLNTSAYLERVKRIVLENVRHIGGPPSVQMTGRLQGSSGRRYSCLYQRRYTFHANRRHDRGSEQR